jgi:hypothetical protein
MRPPTFTRVSDGKPRRRLLISSKGVVFVEFAAHGTPPDNEEHEIHLTKTSLMRTTFTKNSSPNCRRVLKSISQHKARDLP